MEGEGGQGNGLGTVSEGSQDGELDRPSRPPPSRGAGALTMISMVPLVILVPMERAWKKEVFSGPSPVFCLGSVTLMGAMAPALAAAGTCKGGGVVNSVGSHFTALLCV